MENQNPYQQQNFNQPLMDDPKKGMGITGIVLGIIGLTCMCAFFNVPFSVLAIVFGCQGLSRANKVLQYMGIQDYNNARFFAAEAARKNKTAMIMGIISIVFGILIGIFYFVALSLGWINVNYYSDFFENYNF